MVIVSVTVFLTVALVIETVIVYTPGFDGRPEIVNVAALNFIPDGNPLTETLGNVSELTSSAISVPSSTTYMAPTFPSEIEVSASVAMNLAYSVRLYFGIVNE